MKNKFLIILLCFFICNSVCGCSNNNLENENDISNGLNENNGVDESVKNYDLSEIPYNNEIKDVHYVIKDGFGRKTIFADNKLYVYSEKKYLNETHWKSIDFDFTGYKFIGIDFNEVMFMSKNSIAIFNGNVQTIDAYNKKDFVRDYTDKIWKNYNAYIFYNFGANTVNDEYIFLNGEKKIEIPENEAIVNNYIINDRIFKNSELYIQDIFYSNNNNFYYVGHDEDDKCNEYADVECDEKLIRIECFDKLLEDYQDNINYFDGHFLITKDNKMYEVFYK